MQTITIEGLGRKGEGVAHVDGQAVFVPLALPGEQVSLGEGVGDTCVVDPSPDRVTPLCPYFGQCGGCQLQHMGPNIYRRFKTDLVERPLQQVGIDARVERFIDASDSGRRRATLHARNNMAGYMRARSHDLLDIGRCPILVPALAQAPEIARAIGTEVGACDASFTASDTGIDVELRNIQKGARPDRLVPLANRFGLARLSYGREMLLLRQQPRVRMGKAEVNLPMGSFLQATAEAEEALARYVLESVGKARSVADLFCGVGPFALRLAERAKVYAADADKPAIAALDDAVRHTKGLKAVTAQARDLFRDPLTRFELGYDCVVLDPPRAGAAAQVKEIAASKVGHVVMIACDPGTFARDAASLVQAGFMLEGLVAVDQFAWSAHIEVAATFRR
ncbi:class I SAM-dependent RNA methyltransferase [Devosia sp. PTR5]|uniref:Class I SAM-dependent RNA methyltransferase n=1 Tax=Devosia oryzisoli TaxID=2774138 RepID=A0A927FWT7_9HYPH|nr:TRAM domain-containing protein [Devosia oryzisoli]MBD8066338.1 class I SAM-dependent RNA methyltransferase [Devosia oryzisoli]